MNGQMSEHVGKLSWRMTALNRCIRDLFEYALYKFTLYLLTYLVTYCDRKSLIIIIYIYVYIYGLPIRTDNTLSGWHSSWGCSAWSTSSRSHDDVLCSRGSHSTWNGCHNPGARACTNGRPAWRSYHNCLFTRSSCCLLRPHGSDPRLGYSDPGRTSTEYRAS